METKPVGGVLSVNKRVEETLVLTKDAFCRRHGADGWDIQKYHGYFRMATIQQLRLGNGEGWDDSHVKRMHKHFFMELGKQTQRRDQSLAEQVAKRNFESQTFKRVILTVDNQLMPSKAKKISPGVEGMRGL